jgi:hypothetical protein
MAGRRVQDHDRAAGRTRGVNKIRRAAWKSVAAAWKSVAAAWKSVAAACESADQNL